MISLPRPSVCASCDIASCEAVRVVSVSRLERRDWQTYNLSPAEVSVNCESPDTVRPSRVCRNVCKIFILLSWTRRAPHTHSRGLYVNDVSAVSVRELHRQNTPGAVCAEPSSSRGLRLSERRCQHEACGLLVQCQGCRQRRMRLVNDTKSSCTYPGRRSCRTCLDQDLRDTI